MGGADSSGAYKSEPNDMMYYHTPSSDSINQTTDGFLSSLLNDEDLHLMDMAMNDGEYLLPCYLLTLLHALKENLCIYVLKLKMIEKL